MLNHRYPKIHILSKNELAKHISHSKFVYKEAIFLVNDVIKNYNTYWKDNLNRSEPDKNKYVRNAKGTPLGRLLDSINKMVLAPHDKTLPNFIFGGLSGLNHVKAARHLLGNKRKRTVLKMDITSFFEQINHQRVYQFFMTRCNCSKRASKLMANLCTIPVGPKGSKNQIRTIGRGFATSSRLAVWCNLDTFIKLDRYVKKRLKGKDPRIAIYVDDIGITASRVTDDEMRRLIPGITDILMNKDKNQSLPVNEKKTKITSYKEGMEHLGLRLNRNNLSIGSKTLSKINKAKLRVKKTKKDKSARDHLRSLNYYRKYVSSI